MADITPIRFVSESEFNAEIPVLVDGSYDVSVENSSGIGQATFIVGVPIPPIPIKTRIRNAIESSILTMTTAGGYNFNWTSNNRDLALSTFPNFYVRIPIEQNLDFDNEKTNFQSYDNMAEVEIMVITKNSESGYDPQRIGEDELDLAEDDLKKLFGDSGQSGSPLAQAGADMFQYMSSETTYFQSNDIFTPEHRIFKFRLQYTQDRLNPEQIAC